MTDKKEQRIQLSEGSFSIPGTRAEKDGINFSIAVPGQEEVSLILYRKGTEEIIGEYPMMRSSMADSIRTLKVRGVAAAAIEYNFRVGKRVMLDPAARLVAGRDSFGDLSVRSEHQVRSAVPTRKFDWEDDQRPRIPWEDVVSYCLHVRGFTKSRYSGVRNKGTFRGITEKIPYLKELGINQVILLPAYDFEDAPGQTLPNLPAYAVKPAQLPAAQNTGRADKPADGTDPVPGRGTADAGTSFAESVSQAGRSIDPTRKLNYWGFSEAAYFAPKASYAASRHADIEFKSMVHALHGAGIEVIMDMAFRDKVDILYMIRCLEYWTKEYHVDGFRLMIRGDIARMIALCPTLSGSKLICDYFDTDSIYPNEVHPSYRNLADMNDGFKISARRLLKSDEGVLEDFVYRQRANGTDKGVINYITCHDGFTLCDLVSYDKKHNEANGEQNRDGAGTDYSWNCGAEGPTRKRSVLKLRMRQMKNAMSELLLAQGTPMILAGDEFGNSQGGNNNPYCIDSDVTWVDWKARKANAELYGYVRKLIALRRKYRILHMNRPMTGNDQISCGYPDFSVHSSRAWYGAFEYQSRTIGIMYCGMHAKEEEFIYIAYNFYWDKQEFALPYLPKGMRWKQIISSAEEDGKAGTPAPVGKDKKADGGRRQSGGKKEAGASAGSLREEIESRTGDAGAAAADPERKIEVEGRSVLVLVGIRD